jgi:hypothetical protein
VFAEGCLVDGSMVCGRVVVPMVHGRVFVGLRFEDP